jgi:hypothetical protein
MTTETQDQPAPPTTSPEEIRAYAIKHYDRLYAIAEKCVKLSEQLGVDLGPGAQPGTGLKTAIVLTVAAVLAETKP